MAYSFTRASSQRMTLDMPANTTSVLTACCRVKLATLPTNNDYPNRFGLFVRHNGSGLGYYSLILNSRIDIGYYNTGYVESQLSYTWSTGVWYAIAFVWDFTTTTAKQKVFVNGAQVGATHESTRGTVASNTTTQGFGSMSSAEYINGEAAELATYNAELTTEEIASLQYTSPLKVRPQSLTRYWPLVRATTEIKSGTTVTLVNSPTVATHPRIYR